MASPFSPQGREKFVPSRVHYTPESAMGQELARWEIRDRNAHNVPPAEFHRAPGAGAYPYVHQDYPAMLYKADRTTGKPEIVGKLVVESADQEANASRDGYYRGQDVAIAKFVASEQELAVLAANRAFGEQRMSDKARGEAHAAEYASGIRQVASVPEKPVRAVDKRTKAGKAAKAAELVGA